MSIKKPLCSYNDGIDELRSGDSLDFGYLVELTKLIVNKGAIINELGGNTSDDCFRVETSENTHALFVDATNNRIGLFTSSPQYPLDVNGSMRVTGTIYGNVTGSLSGNASTASKWATARTLSLTGDCTGLTSFDGSSNISIETDVNHATEAEKWATPRTLSLAGDCTGSTQIDGSANASITVTVVDDSHNHSNGTLSSLSFSKLLNTPTTLAGYGIEDAYTKQEIVNMIDFVLVKDSVKVATTTSGTLSTDFEAGDMIDGVTLSAGDRILIKNQTNAAENGIYVVNSSGAPTRASDADTWNELVRAYTVVKQGTVNAGKAFVCTIPPEGTLGTDDITWDETSAYMVKEVSVLKDLFDVSYTALQDGHILRYNAEMSKWTAACEQASALWELDEDYAIQPTGAPIFDIDSNGDMMPTAETDVAADRFFELDPNYDVQPKAEV